MTLLRDRFGDGAAGSNVTSSEPGDPNAVSSVVTTGGTLTRDNSTVPLVNGTLMSLKVASTSNADCYVVRTSQATSNKMAGHAFYRQTGALSNGTAVLSIGSTTPTGYVRVVVRTGRDIQLQNNSGGQLFLSSGTLLDNQWYRFEIWCDNTGGAGATTLGINVYYERDTTPIANLSSGTLTSQTTGTGLMGQVWAGRYTGSAAAGTYYIADVAVSDGSVAEIGAIPNVDLPSSRPGQVWRRQFRPQPPLAIYPAPAVSVSSDFADSQFVANDAAPSVAPNADFGDSQFVANDAAASITPNATQGDVTAAANDAAVSVAVSAANADVAGTANDVTVSALAGITGGGSPPPWQLQEPRFTRNPDPRPVNKYGRGTAVIRLHATAVGTSMAARARVLRGTATGTKAAAGVGQAAIPTTIARATGIGDQAVRRRRQDDEMARIGAL